MSKIIGMSEVSVTFSVYGNFDYNRLRMAIKSVKMQKKCGIDIIVSEQNLESKLDGLDKELGFELVYSKPEYINDELVFNAGGIRNKAIERVDSEFVYLNDADIVFYNESYLFELLKLHKDNVSLIKPPLLRLQEPEVNNFIDNVNDKNLDSVLGQLKRANKYLVSLESDELDLKISNKRGRIFTTSWESYKEYLQNPSLKGYEPTFWFDTVHCGGIFTLTDCVREVGNYSKKYLTWGFEDSDLQWKLDQKFGCEMIPTEDRFNVLHLDHNKGYYSKEHKIINENIFKSRKERDINEIIDEDLKIE